MNELVIMHNKQAVTTSLQVAEVFGKEPAKVNRSIEQIIAETGTPKLANENLAAEKSAAKFFAETTYDNRGKKYPMYYMNRDGFTLLAMGFTGKKALQFKIQYIQSVWSI